MRVAIADDVTLFREGLAAILRNRQVDVVHEVGDGAQLLAALAHGLPGELPDAVVVDIRMPPTHTDEGIRTALDVRAAYPWIGILVLSEVASVTHARRLTAALGRGYGYLVKERVRAVDSFVQELSLISQGGVLIDPDLVRELTRTSHDDGRLSGLTERERQTLALIAEGRSNKGIAERLGVSERTVETHVRHAFMTLGIEDDPADHRRVLAALTFISEVNHP